MSFPPSVAEEALLNCIPLCFDCHAEVKAYNRVRDIVRRMQQLKVECKTQNPNHPPSP